jgi:hypothetical protein
MPAPSLNNPKTTRTLLLSPAGRGGVRGEHQTPTPTRCPQMLSDVKKCYKTPTLLLFFQISTPQRSSIRPSPSHSPKFPAVPHFKGLSVTTTAPKRNLGNLPVFPHLPLLCVSAPLCSSPLLGVLGALAFIPTARSPVGATPASPSTARQEPRPPIGSRCKKRSAGTLSCR